MRLAAGIVLWTLALSACRASVSPAPATASAPVVPTAVASASPDGLAAPTAGEPPLFFESFDMLDAQSGWAWKGLSQLYRTDDGALTWHELHLQGKMQVSGASFLSAQDAWLPGVPDAELRQAVFHTVNGGRTWTKLGSVQGPNIELHFRDQNTGWALNGTGAAGNVFFDVYRTADGGSSWSRLDIARPTGADQGPMAGTLHIATGDSVAFMPPETIWVASGAGLSTPYAGLSDSRDGGRSWRLLNPPLLPEYVQGQPPVTTGRPQFVTDEQAFLPVTAGNRLLVLLSQDGGETWAPLPQALPSLQMTARVQFVNTKDGFAACGTSLCTTQDGGQAWQQIRTPFAFDPSGGSPFVSQFDFVDGRTGWAILSDPQAGSLLVETSDGGRTWIHISPRLGF